MMLRAALRGEKGPDYLPFVCVLLWCIAGVEGHGGSNIKEGDRCVPWLCSCFYRGVYYDDGDVWDDVDDPCTKFQCQHNGYFEAVKTGCSFKGECKDRGTTWGEGCIKYSCSDDTRIKGYRLHQAACTWKDGNCYAVGERAVEHCDIYECQLDHGCYVMNLVKSGCKASPQSSETGDCKPMFSFWQDECAVYQCAGEEEGALKARVLTHSHDVMSWPRGHYALLEAQDKCPDLEKGIWMEGSYTHCGDGCNFISQPFELLGTYNKTMFQHQFCVHHDVDDPELIPLYQTYWEQGRYCILRYNGTCPKGFSGGSLDMLNTECYPNQTDDSNTTTSNITDGRLPDGTFEAAMTRLEFCCRYDGEIERPIVLPAKHPFVLFMADNETECQSVQGMRVTKQFWSFCDAFEGKFRVLNGSLPLIKTGDNSTLVNFCYYSPLGCGCKDDNDDIYAVGESKTEDCVTTQCRNLEDHHVMVVTEGGCWDEVHERCRDENATWDDTWGETCLVRQCVRITQPHDHLNVTFKIIDLKKGCRDGVECRPLNYTKERGCYASQCQLDFEDQASFVLIRSGCAVGKDVCIAEGANHTIGCVTLGCDRSKSTCGLHVIKAGCRDLKGKCVNVDDVVSHACSNWTCTELKSGNKFSWKLVPLAQGCADHNGNCYEEGDTLDANCVTYECIFGERPGFYPMSKGCGVILDGKKTCIPLNQTLDFHCSMYRCVVKDGKKQIINEDPACSYKGKCYPANKTFTVGCNKFMCNFDGKKAWPSHIHVACKVDGKCIDPGTVFKHKCHTYKCSEDKKSCHSDLIEYGCKDEKTGECLEPGTEIRKGCTVQVCDPDGLKNPPYTLTSTGCNYEGKCYPTNKTFTVGCNTFMCNFNGKKVWSTHIQVACKVDGKCIDPGTVYKHKCHTYKCSEDKKSCHSDLIELGCKDKETGECLEPGTEIRKGCTVHVCDPDGLKNPPYTFSTGCNYEGKCYPTNKTFTVGCNTFMCNFNGKKVWSTHIQVACKVDGKCIDPGTVFKHNCHTYKCSEDKKSCHSDLIEYGCKDDVTGECVETGGDVRKGCGTYTCRPDGKKNPHVFKSGACPFGDGCLNVGESKTDADCKAAVCVLRNKADPSAGIGIYRTTGCVEQGKCIPFGTERVSLSHGYYCITQKCHAGRFYNIKQQCKDVDDKCIDLTPTGTTYTMTHGGKQCTALCKSTGITITKC